MSDAGAANICFANTAEMTNSVVMNRLFDFLAYPLVSLGDQAITAGQVCLVFAVVLGGYFLSRWVERILIRRLATQSVNPDLIHLIRRVYLITVLAVLVITILDLLNVPLAAFAFISGAIAIGVGFGAQNIINNFISGWILMWERPIRIGDFWKWVIRRERSKPSTRGRHEFDESTVCTCSSRVVICLRTWW